VDLHPLRSFRLLDAGNAGPLSQERRRRGHPVPIRRADARNFRQNHSQVAGTSADLSRRGPDVAEGIVGREGARELSISARRARVLVIDDEPVLLRGLKRSLSEHDVMTATSVNQGMQLYGSHEFDIVFCDLMMPELNGLEFYTRLSALGPNHAQRLVLMTGGVFADRLGCSLAEIPSPCILKPFKHGEIERLISEALERVR
jgi:CheY-like chemotaxis protein